MTSTTAPTASADDAPQQPRDDSPAMAILVNSSDGFRDCWFPFFELFATHWPACRFPLYLNIESDSYEHPSLPIRCLNHPADDRGRKVPWSDRVLASLRAIPEPYVLYMQEDYFLDAPVRNALVEEALRLLSTGGLGCVHLTHFGARRSRREAELPHLVDVPRFSHYRVSTQAAIWDKRVLAGYFRPDETVWEAEILGTMRAWHHVAPIRSVEPRRLDGGPIVSYTGTGIIRGKWHPAVQPLFQRHGIDVDFTRRGFHAFPSRWRTRSRMLFSLARRPVRTLSALLGF